MTVSADATAAGSSAYQDCAGIRDPGSAGRRVVAIARKLRRSRRCALAVAGQLLGERILGSSGGRLVLKLGFHLEKQPARVLVDFREARIELISFCAITAAAASRANHLGRRGSRTTAPTRCSCCESVSEKPAGSRPRAALLDVRGRELPVVVGQVDAA